MPRNAFTCWVIGAAAFSLGACSGRENVSPPFGLYENGEHLVATFHGFADNFAACQIAATAFNTASQSDPAAWAAVGKEPDQWVCAKP